MTEIKQWESSQSGLDQLSLKTAKVGKPGKGEVLVEIHTVSLNYRDTEGTLHRSPPLTGKLISFHRQSMHGSIQPPQIQLLSRLHRSVQ